MIFSVYLRNEMRRKNQVMVCLINDNGEVVASAKIKTEGQGWNAYAAQLVVDKKAARATCASPSAAQEKHGRGGYGEPVPARDLQRTRTSQGTWPRHRGPEA
jgi:hypothetical protein